MRGRPARNKGHGHVHRNSNFESNGPDGKVRGNATQVHEKYLSMAREAASSGDRIMAETLYQHAEHYYRVLNESTDPRPEGAPPNQGAGLSDRDGEGRGMRRNGGYGDRQPDVPPQAMGIDLPRPRPPQDANAEAPKTEGGDSPDGVDHSGGGRPSNSASAPPAPTENVEGSGTDERKTRRGRPPRRPVDGQAPAPQRDGRPRRGRPPKRGPQVEEESGEAETATSGDATGEEGSKAPST